MTDIERKALALVNEVREYPKWLNLSQATKEEITKALCRDLNVEAIVGGRE